MSKDKKEEKKKAKGGPPLWFLLSIFVLTALVFLPFTIVFSVCMIPTLVAAIIDNHPQKTVWLTVGAMNFAGTVPAWIQLWDAGHAVPAAFQIAFQSMTVIIAYGAAAAGSLIHHRVTPLVANVVLRKNQDRLKQIEKRQKELIRKWGEEVQET